MIPATPVAAVTRAVFLDRDGTLIEHRHHLVSPADVRVLEGASQAVGRLQEGGYRCVVVTNQSVIGRGLLTHAGLRAVHEEMAAHLHNAGVRLDGIYYCPVAPRGNDPLAVEHPDRKPAPGMLLRAAAEMGLALGESWMVGDSESDLLAGRNAGCRGSVLVRSTSSNQPAPPAPDSPAADFVARNLGEAADWILARDETPRAEGRR